jgi:predicted TPR repeat methyltransferase
VFHAVADALRPQGYFIFTVESVTEPALSVAGYQLHPSGRYRHSEAYVRQMLSRAGMTAINMTEEILREEIRQPVSGMLFVAQRTA